jgi:DNA helicase II / ATP-dependent DNA helicase PcrA
MTFSRRAAAEMSQLVESIALRVLGKNAAVMTDALTWTGTFHACAGGTARVRRPYAGYWV